MIPVVGRVVTRGAHTLCKQQLHSGYRGVRGDDKSAFMALFITRTKTDGPGGNSIYPTARGCVHWQPGLLSDVDGSGGVACVNARRLKALSAATHAEGQQKPDGERLRKAIRGVVSLAGCSGCTDGSRPTWAGAVAYALKSARSEVSSALMMPSPRNRRASKHASKGAPNDASNERPFPHCADAAGFVAETVAVIEPLEGRVMMAITPVDTATVPLLSRLTGR